MWEWIRYRALILAVLPFVIGIPLWFLSENAGGWDRLGFFLALILSMPVLTDPVPAPIEDQNANAPLPPTMRTAVTAAIFLLR